MKEIKNVYKAEKGLIRVTKTLNNNKIARIVITGDFFLYPETSLLELENMLTGIDDDEEEIKKTVHKFFNDLKVQAPFVKEDDFVKAIVGKGNES